MNQQTLAHLTIPHNRFHEGHLEPYKKLKSLWLLQLKNYKKLNKKLQT